MSGTATAPVVAGLVVGIGFVLVLSLVPINPSQTILLAPTMSLVTASDGKSHVTHYNSYCGQSCDIFIIARIFPLPQIEISNDTEIAFRITSSHNREQQQPNDLHFIIQEIKEDVHGNNLEFNETNIRLVKTDNGNYKTDNLPAGRYVINVVADWNNENNQDLSHSLHRFGVNATTGHNNYPSSNSSEISAAFSSNSTDSVVVIPKGASTPSSGKNFEPSTIRVVIEVNNTVMWTNNDEIVSSVVADNSGVDPDFAAATQFTLGIIPANATNYMQPGKSFQFTFNKPGEIPYYDILHPWMQGTVIVLPPLPR